MSGLEEAWTAARVTWPDFDVPFAAFDAYVTARGEAEQLHTGDLYVACACAIDAANARDGFARSFLSSIDGFVRHLDSSPGFADDVRQQVAEKLLLATPAKLADYAGRGPLAAWIRVVAVRTALNLRAQRSPARMQTLDEVVAALPASADPELDFLRERYLPAFRGAIRDALAILTAQQRTVLRLHLVTGATTQEIAVIYQVNQSTIVRWLQGARGAIRDRTEELLREQLGVSPSELASLTQVILSQLDVSIAGLLDDES